jgi:hypothetical protein
MTINPKTYIACTWFRFTLRGLFLFAAILSVVVLTGVGRARNYKGAVIRIRQLGGEIDDGYGSPRDFFGPEQRPQLSLMSRLIVKPLLGDECLLRVVEINLAGTKATDTDLIALQNFAKLRCLFLGGTEITDAGLKHLRCLSNLRELWIEDTQLSDAVVDDLAALNQLEILFVWNTRISSKGIDRIRAIQPRLQIVQ